MSVLIDGLKEVDLGGRFLSGGDAEYLEQRVVSDIPTNADDVSAVKIIFLMESPHYMEIRKKFPLAGKSGVRVTEDLIMHCALRNGLHSEDRRSSIGSLVERHRKVRKLSIMNVSPLPLQELAYVGMGNKKSNEMKTLLDAFMAIKVEFERGMDEEPALSPIALAVYEVIEEDLIRRIERIVERCQRQPSVVTFGNVARRSICRARKQAKETSLGELTVCEHFPPHPSPKSTRWDQWKLDDLCPGRNRSDLVEYINSRI